MVMFFRVPSISETGVTQMLYLQGRVTQYEQTGIPNSRIGTSVIFYGAWRAIVIRKGNCAYNRARRSHGLVIPSVLALDKSDLIVPQFPGFLPYAPLHCRNASPELSDASGALILKRQVQLKHRRIVTGSSR